VDTVTRAEDIRLHTRVPTVGLVAEMGPSFKQLLHGNDRCRHSIFPSGCASGKLELRACLKDRGQHRYERFPCGVSRAVRGGMRIRQGERGISLLNQTVYARFHRYDIYMKCEKVAMAMIIGKI
jgi:hypothetical protein